MSLRKEMDSFRSLIKHYEALLQQLLQQQQLFNFSSQASAIGSGPTVSSIFSLPAQGLSNNTHSLALSGILANLAVKSAQNSVVSAASLLDSTISAVVNGNSTNACHNNNNNNSHQLDDSSSLQSSPASTPKLTNGFYHTPNQQNGGTGASGMISQSILSSDRKTLLRGSAKRKQPSPKSLQASSSASHSPGSPISPDSLPIEAPSSGPELNMESKNFASELHAARLLMETNFGPKLEKFETSSVESSPMDDSMLDDVKVEGDAESGGGSPSSTSLFSSGSAGGGDFLNHRDIVMFFRCQICSETAPGAEELKLHMMGCHVDGNYLNLA